MKIAAGASHTCAHVDGKEAQCWGFNSDGQLGNNSTIDRSVPARVYDLPTNLVAITAHGNHTCALTATGGVKCWGSNFAGELGVARSANSPTPVDVYGLASGVIAITAGAFHTCALTTSGGIKCWGSNDYGQLGSNGATYSAVPIDVTGLGSGAIGVAAGDWHTCAVTATGGVKCWGYNHDGQLGDGSVVSSAVPADVAGLANGVSVVAGGGQHTCALTTSGAVKCWGKNISGALGNGSSVDSRTPVNVVGLSSGVTAIAGGGYFTCALTTSGAVKCWGYNGQGILGNNSTSESSQPVDVIGVSSGILAIAAGSGHMCAATASNELKCWGYNAFGQLGNGSNIQSHIPVAVVGLNAGASSISTVAMVEYYHAQQNYYFMTSRASDKSLLDTTNGWARTGKAFPVLASRDANSSPITRFYFDQIARSQSRGTHFYTLLPDEVAVVQALNPSNQPATGKPVNEGVDSYAYLPTASGACASGQLPVYRLFRGNTLFPDDPNHRFTTELLEYNNFVAFGWSGEGIKFCVPQ